MHSSLLRYDKEKFYDTGPRTDFYKTFYLFLKYRKLARLVLTVISTPGACIIKLITAVIYGFHNQLECLTLNIRLCWEGLPGTNTLAY